MIEWEKSEIENLLIHLNERGILAPDFKFFYERLLGPVSDDAPRDPS